MNKKQFTIVNWNVNSIKVRIDHLEELIKDHSPDIICLQELKCTNDAFPKDRIDELHYNYYLNGQRTYNGVAILSKMPGELISTTFPGNPLADHARFIELLYNIDAPNMGTTRVISVYVPNGQEVDSDKFEAKMKFYDALNDYIKQINSPDENLIICGDFNVSPFDIDVYNKDKLQNKLCFSAMEKEKFRTLLNNNNLFDSYRMLHPNAQKFSWWDYRKGAFDNNHGLRIDFILQNARSLKFLYKAEIDLNSRSKTKPSDHAPIINYYA